VAHLIAKRFSRKAKIVDFKELGRYFTSTLEFRRKDKSLGILCYEQNTIRLDQVSALWCRRLHFANPLASHPDPVERSLSDSSIADYTNGFLQWMKAKEVLMINDPDNERIYSNKVIQLQMAHKYELTIPHTLISNDDSEVKDFIGRIKSAGRRVIFKPLKHPKHPKPELIPTRFFQEQDYFRLAQVRNAPVIFQEFIEGRDLRVTIVGERVFAGEIIPTTNIGSQDWRLEGFSKYREFNLDERIEQKLVKLLSSMGLVYGAVDLKLAANGEIFFLEVNPAGQYLFMEVGAGLPISEAIAEHLVVYGEKRSVSPRSLAQDILLTDLV